MNITNSKQFKLYVNGINDFSKTPINEIALICWKGRSGQSVSSSKMKKYFNFTDKQVESVWARYNEFRKIEKGFGGVLGLILKLDNYKNILKNPTLYDPKTAEQYGEKNFEAEFGFTSSIIIK
jgi:hypothetical protein